MFDDGFSELLVNAVVALLVKGPERLPKAARFAGLWVRRARAQWHSVRAELERDLASEEMQRSLRETGAAMREAQASLRDIQSGAAGQDVMRGPSPPASPPADNDAGDDAR
jgi:sec-independent protein translocase protein TatB